MSDTPENLVLDHLRQIRADLSDIKRDLVEIKERIGFLEGQYGSLSRRVDRIDGDIQLIKQRLNLVEA